MAITNFVPTIWHAALLENLHAAQIVVPTLNRNYEGDIRNGGETVNITGFTSPTINSYSGSITRQALTDSTQALAIDQQDYFAYLVDDVDRVQAAGSFEPVMADAAAGLADDAEDYAIGLMAAGGTSVGTSAISDFATAYAAIVAMREAMGKAKIPTSARYLAVNPDFASFLLGAGSTLVKVNEAGSDGELRNGVIGRLLGFTVLETPAASLANTSLPAAVAYHGPSVAYADQIVKMRANVALDAFGDQVDGLHVYGAKVLRATAVQTHIAAA